LITALSLPPLVSWIAFAAIAIGLVGAQVGLRRAARRPTRKPVPFGPQPKMTARDAQMLYERVIFIVAPAAVTAGIALAREDGIGIALFVAGGVAVSAAGLFPHHSPLHLMPVARLVLRFALPAGGVAIALLPGLVDDWDFTLSSAVPCVIGAWLIVALGMWLEAGFNADRPIRLAVIGSRDLARKLAGEMRQLRVRDYVVIGYVGPESPPDPGEHPTDMVVWLGDLNEVRDIVQVIGVDLLAVGPDNPRLHVFEETADACLDLPVRMLEASAFYEDVLGHVPIGQINSAWFQCIMHPRYSPTSPASKRMLDLLVALPATILVALPLVIIAAICVKLGDRGPIFFRQTRVGEQGREFDILKLRTMRPDAPELMDKLPKHELITPVGRILRKTHVDELPQLFNVVRGDMTLVGPRPEQPQLVEELARVVPYYERRSLVKPGVTGWAQVRCGYAGSRVGTAWKICHDLYYIKRRSILFDFLILLQTFAVFGERADVELETPAEDFILGEATSLVSR
jgi:lipopolysaccharide/colanic/teichoic acid biosynthesis glycosyltransferase